MPTSLLTPKPWTLKDWQVLGMNQIHDCFFLRPTVVKSFRVQESGLGQRALRFWHYFWCSEKFCKANIRFLHKYFCGESGETGNAPDLELWILWKCPLWCSLLLPASKLLAFTICTCCRVCMYCILFYSQKSSHSFPCVWKEKQTYFCERFSFSVSTAICSLVHPASFFLFPSFLSGLKKLIRWDGRHISTHAVKMMDCLRRIKPEVLPCLSDTRSDISRRVWLSLWVTGGKSWWESTDLYCVGLISKRLH